MVNDGGSVYNLSNLTVVTPLFHNSILDTNYHNNKNK